MLSERRLTLPTESPRVALTGVLRSPNGRTAFGVGKKDKWEKGKWKNDGIATACSAGLAMTF